MDQNPYSQNINPIHIFMIFDASIVAKMSNKFLNNNLNSKQSSQKNSREQRPKALKGKMSIIKFFKKEKSNFIMFLV